MKHTQHTIKTPHKAIVGLLCAFILLFGIGFGIFGVSRVEASNNYIDNIVFTSDQNDTYLGFHPIKISFFVKTTFQTTFWQDATGCWSCFGFSPDQVYEAGGAHTYFPETPLYNRYILVPVNSSSITTISCPVGTQTFTAGNTYSFWLSQYYASPMLDNSLLFNGLYPASFGVLANTCNQTAWQDDTEQYPFLEFPTLNITFPFENAEISEAFYIQGSYTIPENSGITKLIAFFRPVGLPYSTYSFHQNLTYLSGDVSIRSSGIQADDYTIEFCFVGLGIEAICLDDQDINISILTAIPPEFPETQETPPEFYDPIDADQFYFDFSAYDTPTALYSNLKNAIQPIFTTIGSNLTFFSSRFDSETAKNTGEKTGQAILIVRTYSSNLNTFFNDLPVSEFLLFYLTLLIVVIVFRIIKNLINLIKP